MKTLKIQPFLFKTFCFCLAGGFIPIILVCMFKVSQTYTGALTVPTVLLVGVTTVMLFGILSWKGISPKFYLIGLFLLAFGIRLIWILTIATKNTSDFEIIYNAAVRAAHGDFSFTSDVYFYRWGYQLGFTLYEAVILYVFGDGLFILKLFNVLFSTGTAFLVYLIARTLFNEGCGRIAGILYALFIPSIAMASVLTNQHLATFLFYLGIYLLVRYFAVNRFVWLPIGFLLAVGDLIRPEGSIVLIAVGLYILLFEKNMGRMQAASKLGGIILVFFLTHTVVNAVVISSGISQYPMANREPLWKFVTGLNAQTTGVFSNQDSEYLRQFELGEQRNSASKELIKERISDKWALCKLFVKKYLYMWTERDGSLIWGLRSESQNQIGLLENLTMDERWMYISMSIFVLAGALRLASASGTDSRPALVLLLILGFMAIHLLIELQTRYRYFIIPSFMIIQSYGVLTIYSFYKKWWSEQSRSEIEKSQPPKT